MVFNLFSFPRFSSKIWIPCFLLIFELFTFKSSSLKSDDKSKIEVSINPSQTIVAKAPTLDYLFLKLKKKQILLEPKKLLSSTSNKPLSKSVSKPEKPVEIQAEKKDKVIEKKTYPKKDPFYQRRSFAHKINRLQNQRTFKKEPIKKKIAPLQNQEVIKQSPKPLDISSNLEEKPQIIQRSKRKKKNLPQEESEPEVKLGGLSLPEKLKGVSFADEKNIIIENKKLNIRGVKAPYNASIIPYKGRYLLFFRYDKKVKNQPVPFHTFIGCVELDHEFNQTEKEFIKINTKSTYSEDPRAFWVGNEIYLVYNDCIKGNVRHRAMHLARLNPKNLRVKKITSLDLGLHKIEKNWVPFVCEEEEDFNIYLEYYIDPHRVLKVEDLDLGQTSWAKFSDRNYSKMTHWIHKWGDIRGGSPAVLVDDEYLAFFHSSFRDPRGIHWFVMGAYTFENSPRFKLTKISKEPLLCQEMYSAKAIYTAPLNIRCIYPGGIAIDEEKIYVSCGENDSAVRVISFDKKKLIKSLKKL